MTKNLNKDAGYKTSSHPYPIGTKIICFHGQSVFPIGAVDEKSRHYISKDGNIAVEWDKCQRWR